MDGERYYKRSQIIQEMKKFCKENNIKYFSDFMEYCADNREDWFKELCTGRQVITYMVKYLRHQQFKK